LIPFFTPLVFGKITIEADVTNEVYGIDHVDFLVDGLIQENDTTAPYSWTWTQPAFFRHTISVIAYDNLGKNVSKDLILWKFF
jgi:hypothetical protein